MELEKKTTILFPVKLYKHLAHLSKQRKESVGHLVRHACEVQYGILSTDDRRKAVQALRALSLPVSTSSQMKRESIPFKPQLPK